MSIEITINDQLSVAELQQKQSEGFSVLRSAHVGNVRPYNMVLANAGIPLLCVDHTITGIDRNYLPESVVKAGQRDIIAPSEQLVCASRVAASLQPLSEFHLGNLADAVPGANTFTNSQYLMSNYELTEEITTLAAEAMPGLFHRIAYEGIAQRKRDAAAELGRIGTLQLNQGTANGVIIPNELDIILNFVIETLKSERQTQYHLSGPDMVKYIDQEQEELDALYEMVKVDSSIGDQLPDTLKVELVPTTAARFATTKQRAPILESLLGTFNFVTQEQVNIKERRKSFFASDESRESERRDSFISDIKVEESKLEQLLLDEISNMPELFGTNTDTNFISQYDVIDEGGLFVPELTMTLPMVALDGIYKSLQRVRKRAVSCRT